MCVSDWSFRDLFGRFPTNVCPMASFSKVYLDITNSKVRIMFQSLDVVVNPSLDSVERLISDICISKYSEHFLCQSSERTLKMCRDVHSSVC